MTKVFEYLSICISMKPSIFQVVWKPVVMWLGNVNVEKISFLQFAYLKLIYKVFLTQIFFHVNFYEKQPNWAGVGALSVPNSVFSFSLVLPHWHLSIYCINPTDHVRTLQHQSKSLRKMEFPSHSPYLRCKFLQARQECTINRSEYPIPIGRY